MSLLTPKACPQESGNSSHRVAFSSQEEWLASFKAGAWRARWRSLPLLWMLVVGFWVFPIGIWSQSQQSAQAEEAAQPEAAEKKAVEQQAIEQQAAPTEPVENNAADINTESSKPSNPTVVITVPNSSQPSDKPTLKPNTRATEPTLSNESAPALPYLPVPDIKKENDSSPSADGLRRVRVTILVSGQKKRGEILAPPRATVRHAIEAMNLSLGQQDRVSPAASTPLYNNATIRITRVRTEVKSRTISVAPELRYQITTDLRPGGKKTVQSGRTGVIEVSERVWFKDGKVSARESLGRKVVREPQDTIVALGSRSWYMPNKVPYHNRYARAYTLASRSGSPRDRVVSHETKTLRPIRSIIMTATGYSPDPRENGGYTGTATGMPIGYGAAAVDPRVIPLGTKLYVEGYGYAFACDVGGAIKGRKIDLAYNSYREANTKGRKKVRVWILAP